MSALPRDGGPLLLCLLIAGVLALGVRSSRAQTGDVGFPFLGDSAALAESLRIADSIAVADSIAFEEAAAEEAAATFGGGRSILDRQRPTGFLTYNATYNVNRGNRTWSQTADLYLEPGQVQVANNTNIVIGRESRVGRLSKNRTTRTEVAYRLTPFLRVGGAFGIQRQSDAAQSANFTPLDLANDDISAQARFNKRFGQLPVRALVSYGYLDNQQSEQNSKGSTFGLNASTSRDFGNGNNVTLDASQQYSKLTSTVANDPNYLQNDKNEIRDVRFTGATVINRWITADARLASQRSRIERPARINPNPANPDPDSAIVVPETVSALTDNADAGLHFRFLRGALLNLTGAIGRNDQIYRAEIDRTLLGSVATFRADFTRPFLGMNPNVSYENSRSETDLTKKDPGWVEANLTRKLDVNAGRALSARVSTRLTGSVVLTRRRYQDFITAIPFVTPPTDSDNRRMRGTLNFDYKPSNNFQTGMTFGVEQNDLVNLARTSSINNAKLRTYSVIWVFTARPGASWVVTQSNSATAAQQYYTFSPDRDQLSFIYNLTTVVGTQLTQKARFEMTNVLRLQSRGTWRLVESVRRFGKASEFNTLDLTLRLIYKAAGWLDLEAQQRLSASPNSTVLNGETVKTSDSRRTEFTGIARVNYPFSGSAGLTADVRRTLTTDRNFTYGDFVTDRSVDTDYWLVTAGLRKTFGGP